MIGLWNTLPISIYEGWFCRKESLTHTHNIISHIIITLYLQTHTNCDNTSVCQKTHAHAHTQSLKMYKVFKRQDTQYEKGERGERGRVPSVWESCWCVLGGGGILSEMGFRGCIMFYYTESLAKIHLSRNSRKIILERNNLSQLYRVSQKRGQYLWYHGYNLLGGNGWVGLAKNNRHTYYTAHTRERDQFSLSRLRREGTNKSFSPSSRPILGGEREI